MILQVYIEGAFFLTFKYEESFPREVVAKQRPEEM